MGRHRYELTIEWTGSGGSGTTSPRAYSRDHTVTAAGPAPIAGSSDPAFRGDPARWNPEQLFVASIAQCHMLWYLGLAAAAGVVVLEYVDRPTGVMVEEPSGAGQFESVTLRPRVRIDPASDAVLAEELHHRVGEYCFIARSIAVPVRHEVTIETV
ncbi:organic hydroperoxide reductase OsmC/OhrA [Salana multivorans]|uniref:Organic hydroperoxide reductase OsmC/OhrA n=1 Tax=Salana multivorans TaxID=120377 RepID=A0A3N2D2B5_9MICO|nr:OsmC family protein [Salana multivorans]OJX95653.1 MAG: peroxiredoxin [Micrococcales bacterium 73-15]ROR93907.1 organic hydroperoxide reductase OsmC/OhrA [Salana multivorans]